MDPISAMRMTAAGRITPFNPPVLDQTSKAGAGGIDVKQLGQMGIPMGDLSQMGVPTDEIKKLGNISTPQIRNVAGPQFDSAPPGRAFSDFLGEMVRDVNAKQAAASQTVNGVLSGDNVPLHQAVLAVEEASVSFQLMVEVRNKLMESYQELMRMQI